MITKLDYQILGPSHDIDDRRMYIVQVSVSIVSTSNTERHHGKGRPFVALAMRYTISFSVALQALLRDNAGQKNSIRYKKSLTETRFSVSFFLLKQGFLSDLFSRVHATL